MILIKTILWLYVQSYIVCDAEQVIYSEIKKTEGNLVSYMSGAIENLDMRKKVIDVLEGTLPAFNNRESKYQINS